MEFRHESMITESWKETAARIDEGYVAISTLIQVLNMMLLELKKIYVRKNL